MGQGWVRRNRVAGKGWVGPGVGGGGGGDKRLGGWSEKNTFMPRRRRFSLFRLR